MISKKPQRHAGFSLVELMVVIAIIVMMLSVALYAIDQARRNSREKERVSDLGNIQFALVLYNEKNRDFPTYPSGVEIGIGGAIDSIIEQFNGNAYADPRVQCTNGTYSYWYDSDFTCSEEGQVVLFARTMEQSKNANYNDVCTHGSRDGVPANASSYMVIIQ
jgi:prepilin-type N-terminal cleavage/methylation domain-containing protein